MLDYDTTMRAGADRYADVIALLRGRGLPAVFTQTGGMCAAIEAQLEGAVLLVTDAEDSLAWDRDEHRGWGVGLYADREYGDGPLAFQASEDGSADALPPLLERVLRAGPHRS